MRIVVVGAGMAGLTATRQLLRGGHDVALIEAGSRLGGRARTVRGTLRAGAVRRERCRVDRHSSSPHAQPARSSWHGVAGRGAAVDDNPALAVSRRSICKVLTDLGDEVYEQLAVFDAIVHEAAVAVDDPANPQRCGSAGDLDGVSLADVANQAGLDELARLFHRRDSQGEFAAEPAEVSLLFVAQQRAISAASSVRRCHPLASCGRRHRHLGRPDGSRGRGRADHRRDVARRRARQRIGHGGDVPSPVCKPTMSCWRARWYPCAACASIRRCPTLADGPSTSSATARSPRLPSSSPIGSGLRATRRPRVSRNGSTSRPSTSRARPVC